MANGLNEFGDYCTRIDQERILEIVSSQFFKRIREKEDEEEAGEAKEAGEDEADVDGSKLMEDPEDQEG